MHVLECAASSLLQAHVRALLADLGNIRARQVEARTEETCRVLGLAFQPESLHDDTTTLHSSSAITMSANAVAPMTCHPALLPDRHCV